MEKRNLWKREEYIVVLNLYYKLPFGKLHQNTKEVKELAALIGRTKGSVAMRLTNFAACDPYILSTGRHGLEAGKKQCQPYWDEFNNDRESLLFESEKILAKLENSTIDEKFQAALKGIENLQGEDKSYKNKSKSVCISFYYSLKLFREVCSYGYRCSRTSSGKPYQALGCGRKGAIESFKRNLFVLAL